MPSEQDEFLKDLEVTPEDPFAPAPVEEKKPAEVEEDKSNRRERRLQAKLTAERESSIALAARLEALTEAQKFSRDITPSSYEEKASRIYGNATPENAAATELLLASLKEAKEEAKKEAVEAWRHEQANERAELQKEEKTLDSMIEDIEDETGLTIDSQTQKAFFSLLERLSPKDTDGNVIAYADHHAVWEDLQSRKEKVQNTRAKDLASRSMVRTGSSPSTTVEMDANERFLRDNGII